MASVDAVDLTATAEQPDGGAAAAAPPPAIDLTTDSSARGGASGGGAAREQQPVSHFEREWDALRPAAAAAATAGAGAAGANDATIDLSAGPDLMAEARNLSAIFPDLRPASILAVLMDFSDYHDDPVTVVSSLLGERTTFGPASLAKLPRPQEVKGPLGLSAFAALEDAVTTLLAIFPNADPTALRSSLTKKQEDGVDDLVGTQSAEMLEGYVRVSDAAALAASNAAAPLPHELPLDMAEYLPAEEDGYEARTMIRALTVRPTVETANTVPGWDQFLVGGPPTGAAAAAAAAASPAPTAASTSDSSEYRDWAEYALSGRFSMVSLPHIRAVLAERGSYAQAWSRLRNDIVMHGGMDPLASSAGGGGGGGGGGGKKRKRRGGGGPRVLLSTARRPGRAPGGDLPGQLRLEAIFCEHRSTLLAESSAGGGM
jgi:hypothetical protein